ncbi:MAG: tRNA pseudouridine(13) synthase TruD, partial [Planctomycetes bacterium]|nr:tRNA pseudouridine(13) synthase TruD [Planctomycetota bacterium]
QFVTVRDGPPNGHSAPGLTLDYLGRVKIAAGPAVLGGNRFHITVRDLARADTDDLRRGLDEIAAAGLPNYFDEQRFGSAIGGQFIARRLLDEDFEGALKLALATVGPDDSGRRKRIKQTLERAWGNWADCLAELPPCPERGAIARLAERPTDFAGAFERLDRHLRFLYVSAYQSWLWNEILARMIRAAVAPERRLERRIEHWLWPFPTRLEEAERSGWAARVIPLPANKMSDCAPEVRAVLDGVLAEAGLEAGRLRLRGLKETYFGRGNRPAWLFPRETAATACVADELNRGRLALTFQCTLPKGSYATLITRRLFGTWKRGKRLD